MIPLKGLPDVAVIRES